MSVGAVIIGRNEGARLKRCLDTLGPQVGTLVYVDSGSRDSSVEMARAKGAHVVELDMSQPFTAARARNAGYDALVQLGDFDAVQFIDGDCGVEPGWVERAFDALMSAPKRGLVTGWRAERDAARNAYHALAEWEWHRPAGPIVACGGDMMVRCTAFEEAGRFDPTVIAAEDDELCQRIAKAGWHLERLPETMTHHDADMDRFGQWWQRAVRTGHGFAQVADLHPGYFAPERKRVALYAVALPSVTALALVIWWPLALLPLAAYALSFVKSRAMLVSDTVPKQHATPMAGLLVLSKFPNLLGMIRYTLRKRRGADMRIIEYK